jgi:hypothetical protein
MKDFLRHPVVVTIAANLAVWLGISLGNMLTDGSVVRLLGGLTKAELPTEVDALGVLKPAAAAPALVGYSRSNHAHTTQRADCPEGLYAAGIVVDYGGTCHRECDPDGGTVQRIRLNCKPLQNAPGQP